MRKFKNTSGRGRDSLRILHTGLNGNLDLLRILLLGLPIDFGFRLLE